MRNYFKENSEQSIAVHCVAGLGRAPVLVALALIEAGMKYEDAVELIRRYTHTHLQSSWINRLISEKGEAL